MTTASRTRAVGIALAIAGVLAFSIRPVLVKAAYGYGTDAVAVLTLRMVLSLPFVLVAVLWFARGESRTPIARGDLWLIGGLGFIGYYVSSFLDFLGLEYVSAGMGRLLLFLYPTITVVLSALFLKKPIRPRDVVALVVTYSGVALVMWHAADVEQRSLVLGAALIFTAAVLYAAYLVAGSQVVARVGSFRFTAYATSVAAICCSVQFMLLRPLSALDLPLQVYWITLAMALFCTVIPIFITAEALKRIGANHVAMIGALGPVTTVTFGWIGLDEQMTAMQLVGGALVLAGVVLVTLRPGR
jgi:drug/metabolite transporter (DMT)-like permease